jgi:hypothetical protein
MEVTEAITQAEAELANTLEQLRMERELVAMLESDVKKLQIELVGLRSYAQRRGLTPAAHHGADVVPISANIAMQSAHHADLALMARSDAVATVMGDAGEPLDRATIHERFVDGGRFDSIDEISLALSGLKRAGRVEKLGQGLWQLSEASRSIEAR